MDKRELSTKVLAIADEWRNSGVIVKKGLIYKITASGRWTAGPICGWTGPDGFGASPICGGSAGTYVGRGSASSLIGKIGEHGSPFEVGNKLDLTAENDGILFFRINDTPMWMGDNEGFVDVTTSIISFPVEQAVKFPQKLYIPQDIDKPSFASSDKIMGDNDLAIIIGIEGYQNIPKSDFSYGDARLVKEYVKALGFKERNIELLTDEKATKSSIEKSLEAWLKNKAKPDSRVFVYYSGHGAPDPSTGEAYIVPYDGDPNYLSVTGYSLKRLYDYLGKLQVKEVTVVLDSCFSGAGGRSVLAKGARPLVMMNDVKAIPSNMAVLSATQGTQISTSSTEKGHGVFTYYFLKALKEGKKTIAEIYEYIKPLVEDEAKQLNVQQSPSVSPDVNKLKGKFSLRR